MTKVCRSKFSGYFGAICNSPARLRVNLKTGNCLFHLKIKKLCLLP
ncbi:MAG: hypothetical protein AVDCRST_MAG95-3590 [uncultured Adhaeribacter sp.]|uniref:Uncharacterized protein n=1 Tax=uncultured Adhaeribacter sp. TaxID=448109 RepID=A0A6J4JR21_9BACT|nr:MAG: hypothetical protein AVDCRST_MAG95-3590 [uncultured Adhaeribacter sp.]